MVPCVNMTWIALCGAEAGYSEQLDQETTTSRFTKHLSTKSPAMKMGPALVADGTKNTES